MTSLKERLIKKINSFSKRNYFYNYLSVEEQNLILQKQGLTLGEKIYNFVYNLDDPPKCNCGNKLKFKSFKEGYLTYCSLSCKSKFQKRTNTQYEKMKQTYQKTIRERYGVSNAFQIPSVLEDISKNYKSSHNTTSNFEKTIADYIESLGLDIIRNNRAIISPKELDIYIPKLHLAIECNGNYWHSIHHIDHSVKLKLCQDMGIRLVQIMELDYYQYEKQIKENLKRLINGESYTEDFFVFHYVDGYKCQDAFWPCDRYIYYIEPQQRLYQGNTYLDSGFYVIENKL